jgi:hypothetical protein
MARRPASDERSVVGPAPKYPKVERFYLREVARFLRAKEGDVVRFLQSRHLLRSMRPGTNRNRVQFTSARGVALAVAHFRAILGQKYEQGQDPLTVLDRQKALLKKTG